MGEDSRPSWTEQDVLAEDIVGDSPTVPGNAAASVAFQKEGKKAGPNFAKLVGIVAIAGVLGYVVGDFGKPYVRRWIHGPEVSLQDGPRHGVSLRGDEPTRGPADALVTIISFSDYECPHCAKAETTLEAFLEDWSGEPVRVIYKNYPLPLHDQALPAAHAAWAAHMQKKFEPMHKWLFEHRAKVSELDKPTVEKLGIDFEKFSQDLDVSATRLAVDDDRRAGGLIHLRATPSYVINGHIYTANWSPTVWEEVVEWELKAAQELIKQGVKPAEVLEQLVTAPPIDLSPKKDKKEKATAKAK